MTTRRRVLGGLAALPAAPRMLRGQAAARVVILGAGFGGASVARALRRGSPELRVTLVERETAIRTCPMSSGVLAGLWPIDRITFGLDGLRAAGVEVVAGEAVGLDPATRSLRLADGSRLAGDALVLSPGIAFDWGAIEGLTEAAAETFPHAWKAGAQTRLLRDQLVAMEDGGLVVISVPRAPFRCPPGPFERACLIAHYLSVAKPRSKLLILEADAIGHSLFTQAWDTLYPGIVERVAGPDQGEVRAVDPATRRITTAAGSFTPAVANVIPPQRAAAIATGAGLDAGQGWCPIDPVTFELTVAPGIHVIGDSAQAGDMPKSGFSADSQGRVVARAILDRLAGAEPRPTRLINVCYSLAAPDYGFSIADVYAQRPDGVRLLTEEGRTTPTGAPRELYAREARIGDAWYEKITSELYG